MQASARLMLSFAPSRAARTERALKVKPQLSLSHDRSLSALRRHGCPKLGLLLRWPKLAAEAQRASSASIDGLGCSTEMGMPRTIGRPGLCRPWPCSFKIGVGRPTLMQGLPRGGSSCHFSPVDNHLTLALEALPHLLHYPCRGGRWPCSRGPGAGSTGRALHVWCGWHPRHAAGLSSAGACAQCALDVGNGLCCNVWCVP